MKKLFSLFAAVLFAGAMMADTYVAFAGDLVEGDYLITYDGAAMKASVSNNRLQYSEITLTDDAVVDPAANIIWHIAPNGDYWTLYNADVEKYAGGNGTKNQAALYADSTTNNSKWTVSGSETFEFVNKANAAAKVNSNLRRNGTYGFACYSTSTGGALTLYKKQSGDDPVVELPTVTLKGSFDNWGDGVVLTPSANKLHASATINIVAGSYEFKVLLGTNDWRGLDGDNNTSYWVTRDIPFAHAMANNSAQNMTFVADVDGDYTFEWTFASNDFDVTYPLLPLTCAEASVLAKDEIAWLNEVVVTYVNGGNTYVKDATGYELIYANNFGLVAGDVVNGFYGKSSPYNNLPELVPTVTLADLEVVHGEAPAPEEITAAPTEADINKYLIIKGVSIEGEFTTSYKTTLNGTIGDETFAIYNNFKIAQTFEEGKLYNIVGVGSIYKTTLQLYFVSAEEQSTTGLSNTDAAVKAVKTFENGQLVIIKNGVRYNALGAQL